MISVSCRGWGAWDFQPPQPPLPPPPPAPTPPAPQALLTLNVIIFSSKWHLILHLLILILKKNDDEVLIMIVDRALQKFNSS